MSTEHTTLIVTIRFVGDEAGAAGYAEARQKFWRNIRERKRWAESSVEELEAKLTSEFGNRLVQEIQYEIQRAISVIRSSFGIPDVDDFRMFRHRDIGDAESVRLVTAIENNASLLLSMPEYQSLLRRSLAGANLVVGIEIRRYSSLELALFVNKMESLLDFLDADGSMLAPLLSPFIATAFSSTFLESDLDEKIHVHINPPSHLRTQGSRLESKDPLISSSDSTPNKEALGTPNTRAQWLWLIANGSLLIPVLLTLYIAYEAVTGLKSIRAQDEELRAGILNHQLDLLKESREREKVLLDTALQALQAQKVSDAQTQISSDRDSESGNSGRSGK